MECIAVATAATRKALAAAKSLSTILGVDVLGIFHRVHPYLYSKAFRWRVLADVDRGSRRWAEAVARAATSRGCTAVLPMDYIDYYTLSLYRHMFEEVGVTLVSPPHEAIVAAADKRLLQRLGLPTPRGVVVEKGVVQGDLSSLNPPLVVKGAGDASSPRYYTSHEDALIDAVKRGDALIQEFIPGRGRGYFALVVDGRPILEFSHERLVEYEPIGGASLAARGPVDDPLLYDLGRQVVKRLRWSGVVMVEARYATENDEYYVIEVNPKLWGSLDLAVHCGYHFPALVVTAYVLGWNEAETLAEKLQRGKRCIYSWLLDGLRYLPKIPSVVSKLASLCLKGGCDFDAFDPARIIAQFFAAIVRFKRERRRWLDALAAGSRNAERWVERLNSIVRSGEVTIVWDLDGTLVKLPVDWRLARERLKKAGFSVAADSVMATLIRLWKRNRKAFEYASRIVEEVELEAVKRAKLIVDRGVLAELRRKVSRFILVTRQTSLVAEKVLENLGIRYLFDSVIGRDQGSIIKSAALEKIGDTGILIDDNFEVVVLAWRRGWAPILASSSEYNRAKAWTLGLPAGASRQVADFLNSILG